MDENSSDSSTNTNQQISTLKSLSLIGALSIVSLLFCFLFNPGNIVNYGFGIILMGFYCNQEIIHARSNPVEAELLLKIAIPTDADVKKWEVLLGSKKEETLNSWFMRGSPIGLGGANVFIRRFDSVGEAEKVFESTCERGWEDKEWNKYNNNRLIYGGEQGNRYCASPAIEWRYDTSSLCAPAGEYRSYVIFQKDTVLVAIYETERGSSDRIGTLTNEAIQNLASEIKTNSH